MKNLTTGLVILLSLLPNHGFSAESAGYYRMWQGFKKPAFSSEEFREKLPNFMNGTVRVYGNLLNNYLVALPPASKPDFIPDEFALVALGSEQDYRQVRNTPEGKEYGESHWQLFAREKSGSAPISNFFPEEPSSLQSNKAYDLMGAAVDWKKGHTTFFLGLRKDSLTKAEFLNRLSQHVKLAANSFRSVGLKGYLVIANENYEAAYMNWESKEAMQAAFFSAAGAQVQKDAGRFLELLQWSETEAYDSHSVAASHFYETASLIPPIDEERACYEKMITDFCEENDCRDHVIYGLGQREAAEECGSDF